MGLGSQWRRASFGGVQAMNKTELAIIEQIAQLDEVQQQEVLALAQHLASSKAQARFSLAEWLESAQQLRAQLRARYGENRYFNTQATLDEIREEESE
jgi:cAMP phosphodiesterase